MRGVRQDLSADLAVENLTTRKAQYDSELEERLVTARQEMIEQPEEDRKI